MAIPIPSPNPRPSPTTLVSRNQTLYLMDEREREVSGGVNHHTDLFPTTTRFLRTKLIARKANTHATGFNIFMQTNIFDMAGP